MDSHQLWAETIWPLEPVLMSRAYALTKNRQDAEDLVAEVLLLTYSNFHQFTQGTNALAWSLTILRNTHINRFRKSQRQPVCFPMEDSFEDFTSLDHVEEEVLLGRLSPQIVEILNGMNPVFREVVFLRDVAGWSVQRVADECGIPVGTVLSRGHRGRTILRKAMNDANLASVA